MLKKPYHILLFCSILFCVSITGYAKENPPQTEIKMQEFSMTVSSSEQNTAIIKEDTKAEARHTLADKAIGEYISTVPEPKSTSKTHYIKTMYEEYNDVPGCRVRLYADFLMYSSGSFAEILGVERTYWQIESDEGWVLDEPHSGYTKMSPNKFEVYGEALAERASTIIDKQMIDSSSVLSILKFNRWKTVTSTWYEREIISGGFVYEINR